MYWAKRPDHSVFLNCDMASQSGSISHDHIVGDSAVMRDVGIRHDQAVASHARNATSARRAAVDRYTFANHVVVADFESRLFAFELQVLRLETYGCKRKNPIVVADCCWTTQHHVRDELAVLPHNYIFTDNAERANNTGIRNLRSGIDDRGWVKASAHAGRFTN